MFILLPAAGGIYMVLKEYREAVTLAAALLFVAGIDVFRNFRSRKAIQALGKITGRKAKVIRNGTTQEIPAKEVVVGYLLVCEEGDIVAADASIIRANDFSVNEAILTGESVSVEKFTSDPLLQGTMAVRGYALAKVTAVGGKTTLSESGNWLSGLLYGLTLIMSVLPEEIPVAFSTFMALGAYRPLKQGIIAKTPKTVETPVAATVICLDKTGTLTQNLMEVALTFNPHTGQTIDFKNNPTCTEILAYAMWAGEEEPFDPMEISGHPRYAA